jgi:hypothetical protein
MFVLFYLGGIFLLNIQDSFDFDTEDLLNRKKFAEALTQFIDNYNKDQNDPLIIALDASWGMGKTCFVYKWKNMLAKQNKHVIYYNAWENDDWSNALIPILGKIKECNPSFIKFAKTGAKVIATTGGVLSRQSIRHLTGIDTKEIANEIKAVTEDAYDLISNGYKELNKAKKQFVIDLSKLVNKYGHIYFFIDELDRCRPIFAIETLESIKHFFGVQGITFIVSLDMLQLSYSVAKIYGQNIDSSGYLSRFFNFKFNFPDNSLSTYIFNKLTMNNIPIDIIIQISEAANLSFREAEHIINSFIFLRFGILKNIIANDILEVYYFFILLKYKYPKTYQMILDNKMQKYKSQFTPTDGELSLEQKNKMGGNVSSIFALAKEGFLHQRLIEIQQNKHELLTQNNIKRLFRFFYSVEYLESNKRLIDLFVNDLEFIV